MLPLELYAQTKFITKKKYFLKLHYFTLKQIFNHIPWSYTKRQKLYHYQYSRCNKENKYQLYYLDPDSIVSASYFEKKKTIYTDVDAYRGLCGYTKRKSYILLYLLGTWAMHYAWRVKINVLFRRVWLKSSFGGWRLQSSSIRYELCLLTAKLLSCVSVQIQNFTENWKIASIQFLQPTNIWKNHNTVSSFL